MNRRIYDQKRQQLVYLIFLYLICNKICAQNKLLCGITFLRLVKINSPIDSSPPPAETLPASAISPLPVQKVRLGNSSIGVMAGFHF